MAAEQVTYNSPDGATIGKSATEKVSFYGVTPVVQAAAITTAITTPTATDIATAINSIIAALKNIGITA
jgi:hypothetical protein